MPRNSITNIGTYLHNYQLQLTRLIPFISRLADFFQREPLITNQRDRIETEEMAHCIGKALREIVYATAPIAHLVEDVKMGDRPGAFQLISRPRPEMITFVAAHSLPRGTRSESNLPREKQEELKAALIILKEKLTDANKKLMQEDSKAATLALSIRTKVDKVIEEKRWGIRVRDLLSEGHSIDNIQEKMLLEILSEIPLYEGYELVKGNLEVMGSAVPATLRILARTMGEEFPVQERKKLIHNLMNQLKEHIILPPEIKMYPEFDPALKIEEIILKHFNAILHELFDFERHHNRARLAEVLKLLLIKVIGECTTELVKGFNKEYNDVEILYKCNVKHLLKMFDSNGLGVLLDWFITEPLLAFGEYAYKVHAVSEEEKKDDKKEDTVVRKGNDNLLRKELKEAMEGLGINKEDIADTIGDINKELEYAYINCLKQEFKEILKGNANYDPNKHRHINKLLSLQ